MADEFEKAMGNLRVSLDIDNQLTWGELIRFVDLARQIPVDPDKPVTLQHDDVQDEERVTALSLYLHPSQLSPGASAASE